MQLRDYTCLLWLLERYQIREGTWRLPFLSCGPEKLPKNEHSSNVLMERRKGARKIPGEKKKYLPLEMIGSGNGLI